MSSKPRINVGKNKKNLFTEANFKAQYAESSEEFISVSMILFNNKT